MDFGFNFSVKLRSNFESNRLKPEIEMNEMKTESKPVSQGEP